MHSHMKNTELLERRRAAWERVPGSIQGYCAFQHSIIPLAFRIPGWACEGTEAWTAQQIQKVAERQACYRCFRLNMGVSVCALAARLVTYVKLGANGDFTARSAIDTAHCCLECAAKHGPKDPIMLKRGSVDSVFETIAMNWEKVATRNKVSLINAKTLLNPNSVPEMLCKVVTDFHSNLETAAGVEPGSWQRPLVAGRPVVIFRDAELVLAITQRHAAPKKPKDTVVHKKKPSSKRARKRKQARARRARKAR